MVILLEYGLSSEVRYSLFTLPGKLGSVGAKGLELDELDMSSVSIRQEKKA